MASQKVATQPQVLQVSFGQSQAVAQNLVSAAMCEIMRARNILPEDCFEPTIFASNTLHKFKEDVVKEGENENAKAHKLHNLIRHDICKAIRERVLRKVVLSIYSSKEVCKENLLESYSFHFAYDGEKCSIGMEAQTPPSKSEENKKPNVPKGFITPPHSNHNENGLPKEKIQAEAEITVRSLLSLLQQLPDLPTNHFMTHALFYNDSLNAMTYKASSAFTRIENENGVDEEAFEGPLCESSILPKIKTGYHELAIQLKTREDEDGKKDKYKTPSPTRGKTSKSMRSHPYAKPEPKAEEDDGSDVRCSQEPNWHGQQHAGPRCAVVKQPIIQR